jgi:hypothetical protein
MDPHGPSIVPRLDVAAQLESADPPGPSMRTGQAAAAYFAVLLAVSLLAAPLRDLVVRSGSDPVFVFLIQAVVTLFVLTWAAGWVAEAFSVPADPALRLSLGFGAVGALVATDVAARLCGVAVTPLDLVPRVGRAEGAIMVGALVLGAFLPTLRNHREA